MTIDHHPSDDILLAYTSGSLDEASSMLIATHLALCPQCRVTLNSMEMLGGELFEDTSPVEIASDSFEKVIARIDSGTESQDLSEQVLESGDDKDVTLPRPLRDYVKNGLSQLKWRWMGRGAHCASVPMTSKGPKAKLLRISPGTKMPQHGHSGEELTMVLAGGYSDASGSYRRGDVEVADGGMVHQPVADSGEDCICLVVTNGYLRPTSILARLAQPIMGF